MKYVAAFFTLIFGIVALVLVIPTIIFLVIYMFYQESFIHRFLFHDDLGLPNHFMFDGREYLEHTTVKFFNQKQSI